MPLLPTALDLLIDRGLAKIKRNATSDATHGGMIDLGALMTRSESADNVFLTESDVLGCAPLAIFQIQSKAVDVVGARAAVCPMQAYAACNALSIISRI